MTIYKVSIRIGKKRLNWVNLLGFSMLAFAGIIGAAEAFWYFLTGGFSPLIGGFALVVALLLVIRIIGAHVTAPVIVAKSGYCANRFS